MQIDRNVCWARRPLISIKGETFFGCHQLQIQFEAENYLAQQEQIVFSKAGYGYMDKKRNGVKGMMVFLTSPAYSLPKPDLAALQCFFNCELMASGQITECCQNNLTWVGTRWRWAGHWHRSSEAPRPPPPMPFLPHHGDCQPVTPNPPNILSHTSDATDRCSFHLILKHANSAMVALIV